MSKKRLMAVTGAIALISAVGACHGPRHSAEKVAEHADWMVDRVSKKLDLNEQQKNKLDVLKTRLLDTRSAVHDRRAAEKEEVLALLTQPTLDRARAKQVVNRHTAAIEAKAPEVIAAFGDFYDSLTSAQQQILRDHVQSRFSKHYWH